MDTITLPTARVEHTANRTATGRVPAPPRVTQEPQGTGSGPQRTRVGAGAQSAWTEPPLDAVGRHRVLSRPRGAREGASSWALRCEPGPREHREMWVDMSGRHRWVGGARAAVGGEQTGSCTPRGAQDAPPQGDMWPPEHGIRGDRTPVHGMRVSRIPGHGMSITGPTSMEGESPGPPSMECQ